jgi:hypothetical protein
MLSACSLTIKSLVMSRTSAFSSIIKDLARPSQGGDFCGRTLTIFLQVLKIAKPIRGKEQQTGFDTHAEKLLPF